MSRHQQELFNKLLKGSLSPEEIQDLIEWLGRENIDPSTAEQIIAQLKQKIAPEQLTPELQYNLEARLPLILSSGRPSAFRIGMRYAAAAAIIVLLGIGSFLLLRPKKSEQSQVAHVTPNSVTPLVNDVAPGKNGAILTLADGRTVVLDSMGNGVVATQNGSQVLLDNGRLLYNEDGSQANNVVYNTISTPRGRQFEITLSDGTKVWLNAASSLRYPTAFTGSQRNVEITGEAYFEVAKNPGMPFKVKINDQTQIEVLGTHFNINAYSEEPNINTTLLEGSVKVLYKGESTIIKPGQQSQISNNNAEGKIKVISDVNVSKVIAWKNGVFDFQDATLEEVMRQLERWYDVDVTYEKGIPKCEFFGKMGRDLTLANVLKGLELSKVHSRLEGRKLIVMP